GTVAAGTYLGKKVIDKFGDTPGNNLNKLGISPEQQLAEREKFLADQKKYFEEKTDELFGHLKEENKKLEESINQRNKLIENTDDPAEKARLAELNKADRDQIRNNNRTISEHIKKISDNFNALGRQHLNQQQYAAASSQPSLSSYKNWIIITVVIILVIMVLRFIHGFLKKMLSGENKCKVRSSTAKRSGIDGHENCGSCPGNYYNGGECNFGGHHILAEEVARINKNFDGLDNLTRRHNKLKTSLNKSKEEFEKEKEELLRAFDTAKQHCSDINTFIYGSCIGVEKQKPIFLEEVKRRFENAVKFINSYIESVRNLTQQQMQDFETKLKKVEELKEEISKLQQAYKNTTDPTEKARLDELISQKKGELRNLSQELAKHPAKNF
ncbi:1943_t:CDS:2, partial [Cetraspora pellucida]